jgi:hypothetical protein
MKKENVKVEEIRLIDHKVASSVYRTWWYSLGRWQIACPIYENYASTRYISGGTPIWLGEKIIWRTQINWATTPWAEKTNDKGQYMHSTEK